MLDAAASGARLCAALATFVGYPMYSLQALMFLASCRILKAVRSAFTTHSIPRNKANDHHDAFFSPPFAMTDTDFARALDLTRSVTDILNKGGAIGGLVGQVLNWLTREGIPEGEFAYCLEKSKALIYPNDNGLKIRSRLQESDAKLKAKPYIAGLRLVSALSIGRWMTYNSDYCYLATTVAALFTSHDMAYASEVVCDMLLDEGNHEGRASQVYRYETSRLLPVAKKIVESITLNVVNGSGNFDNLPEEIRGTCSHQIDSHTFAAAAMAISRSSGDVIICCNRFLAGLYVWLLAHIEGEISLSIAGKIIHRATSGRPLRSVTMLADEACSERHDEITSTLVISTDVGGILRTMLRHTADHAKLGVSCVNIRQPLYDLVGYKCASQIKQTLNRRESREIRIAGHRIVRWLMSRPAIADYDSRIVYSTGFWEASLLPDHVEMTVGRLLSRWPAICNDDFGPGTPEFSVEASEDLDNIYHHDARTVSLGDILSCFFHARAIIEHARGRCQCTSCRIEIHRASKYDWIVSKPGCLAYVAEDHLCLIVAHALADGFGIPDASNLRDSSVIRDGMQKLMSELLFDKRIVWKTWFSLAACTYLGCEPTVAGEQDAELVAIQHGSEVVVAPWVDLRSELEPQGSFCCSIVTGQLRGMETDSGVLYTEETSPPAGTSGDWKLPELHSMTTGISEISLQTTISLLSEPLFKLTTIAKAGNYLRIINPATALMAFQRSWAPQCYAICHGAPAQNHQMWSAEDAFGLWDEDDHKLPTGPILPWIVVDALTHHCIADQSSLVRLNLLMALSSYGCVLKQENCCLTCAIALGNNLASGLCSRRIVFVTIPIRCAQKLSHFRNLANAHRGTTKVGATQCSMHTFMVMLIVVLGLTLVFWSAIHATPLAHPIPSFVVTLIGYLGLALALVR